METTYQFRVVMNDVLNRRNIEYGMFEGTRTSAIELCNSILPQGNYKSVVNAWIISPVMTPVEPWVTVGPLMPPPESALLRCRICGCEMTGPMLDLALRDLSPGICSPVCREREVKMRFACCEKATVRACVCAYAFDCEVHGETHVGSHD